MKQNVNHVFLNWTCTANYFTWFVFNYKVEPKLHFFELAKLMLFCLFPFLWGFITQKCLSRYIVSRRLNKLLFISSSVEFEYVTTKCGITWQQRISLTVRTQLVSEPPLVSFLIKPNEPRDHVLQPQNKPNHIISRY